MIQVSVWSWICEECAQRQRKSVEAQGCRRVTLTRHGRWRDWLVLVCDGFSCPAARRADEDTYAAHWDEVQVGIAGRDVAGCCLAAVEG